MAEKLSLKANIIWNSAGSFIYLLSQWIIAYLVTFILGFEDAGVFSLAVAIANVAFAFAIYGVRGYQVTDIAHKYTDMTYLSSRVFTSALAMIGSLLYIIFYGRSLYITICVLMYVLFKMSEAFSDVYHGIIQKSMRMDFIGKSFILRGIVTSLTFVITAFITRDLLLATSLMTIASITLVYLYDYKKSKQFSDKSHSLSFKKAFRLTIECWPLATYTFLTSLTMSIPRINLEYMKGSEILGVYASIAIPAAIVQILAGYIFSPMLGIFADHINTKSIKLFYRLFNKTMIYILLLSSVLLIISSLLGDLGLKILFGDKISTYTYLLNPIIIVSSFTAISWFIGLMLTTLREYRGLILATTSSLLLCIISSNYFIDVYGINGTNVVLILSLCVQIVIMSLYMILRIRKLNVIISS